jgi:hypothetical protein
MSKRDRDVDRLAHVRKMARARWLCIMLQRHMQLQHGLRATMIACRNVRTMDALGLKHELAQTEAHCIGCPASLVLVQSSMLDVVHGWHGIDLEALLRFSVLHNVHLHAIRRCAPSQTPTSTRLQSSFALWQSSTGPHETETQPTLDHTISVVLLVLVAAAPAWYKRRQVRVP